MVGVKGCGMAGEYRSAFRISLIIQAFIRYGFVPIYGIAFLIWCVAWYR